MLDIINWNCGRTPSVSATGPPQKLVTVCNRASGSMSFLGFSAMQQAQQGMTGTSPQKIGALQHHQQAHDRHQQQYRLSENQTRSGAVEIQKLTKQYQEEGEIECVQYSWCPISAFMPHMPSLLSFLSQPLDCCCFLHSGAFHHAAARLSEQLDLSGVPQKSLSLEALSDLKLWVQLLCALQVTQASPQVLLAAWAMLLVNNSKATLMHVSPRHKAGATCCQPVWSCGAVQQRCDCMTQPGGRQHVSLLLSVVGHVS